MPRSLGLPSQLWHSCTPLFLCFDYVCPYMSTMSSLLMGRLRAYLSNGSVYFAVSHHGSHSSYFCCRSGSFEPKTSTEKLLSSAFNALYRGLWVPSWPFWRSWMALDIPFACIGYTEQFWALLGLFRGPMSAQSLLYNSVSMLDGGSRALFWL